MWDFLSTIGNWIIGIVSFLLGSAPFLIGIIGLKHINSKENKVKEEKAKTIKKIKKKLTHII